MSEEATLSKEETTDKVEEINEQITEATTPEPEAELSPVTSMETDTPALAGTAPEKITETAYAEESTTIPFPQAETSMPEFEEPEEDYIFPDEDKPVQKTVRFNKEEKEFSRDEWILSQIGKEHLMEYLTLEQKRNELDKQLKETREKRLFNAFELTLSLAAIVAVVYLLRDNPTILVNILYIAGIIAGLWLWKNTKEKK